MPETIIPAQRKEAAPFWLSSPPPVCENGLQPDLPARKSVWRPASELHTPALPRHKKQDLPEGVRNSLPALEPKNKAVKPPVRNEKEIADC